MYRKVYDLFKHTADVFTKLEVFSAARQVLNPIDDNKTQGRLCIFEFI